MPVQRLVAVPVLVGSIGVLIWRFVPMFRKYQPKIDTVNRVLREQINGMRVVRAFVREADESFDLVFTCGVLIHIAPTDLPRASIRPVSADYFAVMRMPMVRGRAFASADRIGAAPVAIISETMAARLRAAADVAPALLLESPAVGWQRRMVMSAPITSRAFYLAQAW